MLDIEYYMKLQNAYSTKNKREKELVKVNRNANKHFDDTFDTQDVLVNEIPMQLMIIKDTDGNTYKKKIKSRHKDIIKLGDYIKWNNQIWMITLLDSDDKAWNRGYMYLCEILLRWQDDNGNIIERWGYSEDYTKYSMGESGNSTITVGDYQYGITLPVDEYTKKLNRENRFVVDFEGNYPPDTYRLTGKKGFISDYRYFDKGGVFTITLSYEQFNSEKDKLVKLDNSTEVWICDYISHTASTPTIPSTPSENLDKDNTSSESDDSNIITTIFGGNTIRCNRKKTWSVNFTKNNESITTEFEWKIKSDFEISSVVNENTIQIKIEDENLIGETFILCIYQSDKCLATQDVEITDSF